MRQTVQLKPWLGAVESLTFVTLFGRLCRVLLERKASVFVPTPLDSVALRILQAEHQDLVGQV